MITQKLFFILGTALGGLSVAIGAFGVHALRATLEAGGRADTFETAVRYQFYHVFALLLVATLMLHWHDRLLVYAGWLFLAGILVFSGSLYVLCLTGMRWLGAVTPLGGVALMAGWALLLTAALRQEFHRLPAAPPATPQAAGTTAPLQPLALRLTPGQDLRQSLDALVRQHRWPAACVVSVVGSLRHVSVRLANQDTATHAEGHFEIVSLEGTLSVNGSHLHLSVADSTGRHLGGHLMEGCQVYTTAEVVVGVLPGYDFKRAPDPGSGYRELVVTPL